jgi:hypothetical protein
MRTELDNERGKTTTKLKTNALLEVIGQGGPHEPPSYICIDTKEREAKIMSRVESITKGKTIN